jgi:UDP-N-acetylmuramoylalanine--D-glutamate ligase
MTTLRPDRVVIFGAGREAEAALQYLAGAGAERCFLLDDDPPRAMALAARFPGLAFAIEKPEGIADGAGLLLRAPSVKLDHVIVAWAEARGVPHTTFTGFWLARHRDRVSATVTGTKGKSTTTVLLAQLLSDAGAPTRPAGNLGVPPKIDEARPEERFVIEMSSYQCSDAPASAPVHVITNLHREHLDWHGGFEAYWRAKRRPLEQDPKCFGVLRGEQAWLMKELPNRYAVVEAAVAIGEGRIRAELFGRRGEAPLPPEFKLDGVQRLNLATALTAALATQRADYDALCAAAARAGVSFQGLPSRQAVVGTWGDRIWVDDALATIPEATLAALERWGDKTVRLITGGKDRGQDLGALAAYLKARASVTVHAYGPTGERLVDLLDRPDAWTPYDFEDVIARAFAASAPGDVILFSPGAASFEPGWSYETRSKAFKAAAEKWGLRMIAP